MNIVSNAVNHFKTITEHKKLVMKYCFEVGLYRQGIMHDLSKYSPTEFIMGIKYYQGYRSPNNAEREAKGYSASWLHHKGRNKHHFEYWIDYAGSDSEKVIAGMKMPVRYVLEMFIDRVAACEIYQGEKYNDKKPLAYYNNSRGYHILHNETRALLEKLLTMLALKGREKTFNYVRWIVKHNWRLN